jgi:hypothetical protein
MDEDLKGGLQDFDIRLKSIEKRIDDVKWFIGGATGLFTVVFGLVTLVGNLNFNAERERLHQWQRDLKSELGKVEEPPTIDLLGVDGDLLANQEIVAEFSYNENKQLIMRWAYVLKNSGKSLSGPLYAKFYTSKLLPLYNRSTDEPKFEYEEYASPGNFDIPQIPGSFSINMISEIFLSNEKIPPAGKYPALIKYFYGRGKVAKAPVLIVVTEKESSMTDPLRRNTPNEAGAKGGASEHR